jgi:hypothetical protein
MLMKIVLLVLLALFLMFTENPAEGAKTSCYQYEPTIVALEGKLSQQSFPGPPNFESIREGDRKETSWFLDLEMPICTEIDPKSQDVNVAERNIRRLQIVLGNEEWNYFKQLNPKVGKRVHLDGTLFHAHTGHHHTKILLNLVNPYGTLEEAFKKIAQKSNVMIATIRPSYDKNIEVKMKSLTRKKVFTILQLIVASDQKLEARELTLFKDFRNPDLYSLRLQIASNKKNEILSEMRSRPLKSLKQVFRLENNNSGKSITIKEIRLRPSYLEFKGKVATEEGARALEKKIRAKEQLGTVEQFQARKDYSSGYRFVCRLSVPKKETC